MRLTENVYMVGSGLSHEFDSSVYIIKCGRELVMIDTGAGCKTGNILKNIEKDGFQPDDLSTILLTHSHADHAGGAGKFKEIYNPRVYISKEEADFIKSSDDSVLKLDIAKRSGLYSTDYKFYPCEPSDIIKDGDTIIIGDFAFHSITVPGHSEGSVCFKVELPEGLALFTGDVVFAEGVIGLLNCDGSDLSSYRKNIQKLSGLGIELLFPGHFVFVLSNGQKHIDKAVESLKLLGLPRNFL